jgi:predicted DNA-binding WGR domain protein
MKRIFIFQDAKSQKFWSIDVERTGFTVQYGRLGTEGQTSTKNFDTEEKCQKEADKLIAEKTKKGYIESTEETVKNTKAESKKYYTHYDSGTSIDDLAEKILKDPKRTELKHIVLGDWGDGGEGESCQAVIDMFVENADKFSHIESLFLGDMDYESCEVSWIVQGNYSKLWAALPNLKSLTVKGSQELELGIIDHQNLQNLEIICGGLGSDILKSISEATLPGLETLKLYLGIEDYGFDGDVDDIKPILDKNKFSKLKYLGLMDSEITDDLVALVLESDILPQLEILDFSYGTLSDEGGNLLLDNVDKLAHLKLFNLEYHYMSEEMMAKLKKLPCKVNVNDPQGDDDDYKYPMLTE